MFSEEHLEEVRAVEKIVDTGLNSVHEELEKFKHLPPHYLSYLVKIAAEKYIILCFEKALEPQNNEEQ